MDNALLCTCPYGEHRGVIVAEANSREPLEAFAAKIGLGGTTVNEVDRLRFPE